MSENKKRKEIRKIIDFILKEPEKYKNLIIHCLFRFLEERPNEVEAFKRAMEEE